MDHQKQKASVWAAYPIFGIPLGVFAACSIVVLVSLKLGILPEGLIGGMAFMFILGAILGEIGDRIPIWNDFIGGGTVLAFLGSAVLLYFGLIPKSAVNLAESVIDTADFLNLFIAVLITGSILAVDRKMLLKAIVGYIPAILIGVLGAGLLGVGAGLIFGISPIEIISVYVLPIMGGGNGAGAIPLSQIYAQIQTEKAVAAGQFPGLADAGAVAFANAAKAAYYSRAIAILTIANVFAIIGGALLDKLGKIAPKLTGNGRLMKGEDYSKKTEAGAKEATSKDVAAGLVLALAFYVLGLLFSKVILPKIGGFIIHNLAYMVIFVAIVNGMGIIPVNVRQGAKKLQSFFAGRFLWLLMVGVGLADTDIGELIAVLTPSTVAIALFVVVGAVLGAGFGGMIFKFYFVESAISAGLCMANRGGSGDLAVLGAAKRMDLISFAQISSRLGGGIILVIASIFMSLIAH